MKPRADAPGSVSVAMATYNGERYLREQLTSLAQQEVAPGELVVCDDSSQDSTVAILQEFARKAPFGVNLVQNRENIGYSASFIAAAQRCTGDLVLFCDQDDVWSREKTKVVSRVAASCRAQVITHDLHVFSRETPGRDLPSYFAYLRAAGFSPAVCVKGCATAVKSDFIRSWGWPTAQSGVSYDFWIALLATALRRRAYIDRPLVEHRLHAGNTSGWIASDDDRVRSLPWSDRKRRRQSDQSLLIELCIKRRNLHWCDEFIRVLKAHGTESNKETTDRLPAGNPKALFFGLVEVSHTSVRLGGGGGTGRSPCVSAAGMIAPLLARF